jgi:hypothetical protein
LSEIDLSDSRTPTWPQLKLDVPLQQLYACLGIYFATLAVFWLQVAKVFVLPEGAFNPIMYAALVNYVGMMWLAWRIQKTLHVSGLYRHGAWQVWVGALLLNPCALGWWIPVSVMLRAHRIRTALRARWPHATGA